MAPSTDNIKAAALSIKDPFTFEFLGLEAKDAVSESDLGQLNSYVGYYKKNEMADGDNPPVGILLCTDKGSEMVEYVL